VKNEDEQNLAHCV